MDRGFDVPPEAGICEHEGHVPGKARIRPVNHRLRGLRWMKIKRHAQRLSAFEDRPEEAIVEVAVTDMAIDHRTLEADADAALEFPGGGAWIRRRNRRKTGE